MPITSSKYVNLLTDFGFKRIFGDKILLKEFLKKYGTYDISTTHGGKFTIR